MIFYFRVRSFSTPTARGAGLVTGFFGALILYYLGTQISEASLLFALYLYLIGTIVFIGAIFLIFGYMGLSVNTSTKVWSEYATIFNLRFAKTSEPIPVNLSYILIFDAAYTNGHPDDDIQSDSIDFYEISVVYNENRKKVFSLTTNKNDAIETAKKMKDIFDLEIIDKTL
ncbi:MAG: hypothetical protein PSX81_02440 [bacterium]|nr:hypothetical protein [bacterium]